MATSGDFAAQKVIIQYCVDRGMTPAQTKREMDTVPGRKPVSKTLVYTWHKKFREGLDVKSAIGRPAKDNSALIKQVKDVIDSDRRQTVREVASRVGVCKSLVHKILSESLHMSRVSARWVPKILSTHEMVNNGAYFEKE